MSKLSPGMHLLQTLKRELSTPPQPAPAAATTESSKLARFRRLRQNQQKEKQTKTPPPPPHTPPPPSTAPPPQQNPQHGRHSTMEGVFTATDGKVFTSAKEYREHIMKQMQIASPSSSPSSTKERSSTSTSNNSNRFENDRAYFSRTKKRMSPEDLDDSSSNDDDDDDDDGNKETVSPLPARTTQQFSHTVQGHHNTTVFDQATKQHQTGQRRTPTKRRASVAARIGALTKSSGKENRILVKTCREMIAQMNRTIRDPNDRRKRINNVNELTQEENVDLLCELTLYALKEGHKAVPSLKTENIILTKKIQLRL